MTMPKALTIAGSDSSGGAGMQADLKTFQELGVYGMTALTSIVTMDPKDWSHGVFPLPLSTLQAQLTTILDIGIDAFKTGMLGTPETVTFVADKIKTHHLPNFVCDPVLICKGVGEVLDPSTMHSLRDVLIPLATVVTPNLVEAGHLSGLGALETVDDMKQAAAKIHALGARYVVVKGGGRLDHRQAVDMLYDGHNFEMLVGDRIDTTCTHGAGCTFAAAIAAGLAKGQPAGEAIKTAKIFITEAIRHSFRLTKHVGPTYPGAYRNFGNHCQAI